MMLEWPTIALYRYAPRTAGGFVDPVFGKPLNFFLFTLLRRRTGCMATPRRHGSARGTDAACTGI
jgi:hypothetical protein